MVLRPFKILLYKLLRKFVHVYYLRNWTREIKQNTLPRRKQPALFFGTVPILNISYWSRALRKSGYQSDTIVTEYYSINNSKDYDFVLNDENSVAELLKPKKRGYFYFLTKDYRIFDYLFRNYDIYHICYQGFNVLPQKYWELESTLIRKKGGKLVIIPYGGDLVQLSKYDFAQSFKHGYLTHYPGLMRQETEIKYRFEFFNKIADVIFAAANPITKVWTFLSASFLTIELDRFPLKKSYPDSNGNNGVIKIAHSPNHRFLKGTEFLIHAIQELKQEGLQVELILLENIKNDEVLRILNSEADILVDQLLSGYALSAVEGMAAGLPTISNMDDHEYDRKLYRRFSFLNECPLVSGNPENIKSVLRVLIQNPELRKELGEAGRKFVEKYHSEKTAQFMFGATYKKIWMKEDIDLMNLFHPLLPNSYNNQSPLVSHPLKENSIPEKYYMNSEKYISNK